MTENTLAQEPAELGQPQKAKEDCYYFEVLYRTCGQCRHYKFGHKIASPETKGPDAWVTWMGFCQNEESDRYGYAVAHWAKNCRHVDWKD